MELATDTKHSAHSVLTKFKVRTGNYQGNQARSLVKHVSMKPETQMHAHLAANFPGVKLTVAVIMPISKHAMVATLAVKRSNAKKNNLLLEISWI